MPPDPFPATGPDDEEPDGSQPDPDEFPPDEVESGPKAPERLATTNTNPPEDIPVMNN